MFKSLEPTHLKFTARFDILLDLATYLKASLTQLGSDEGKRVKVPKTSKVSKKDKITDIWNSVGVSSNQPDITRIIERSLVKLQALQSQYGDAVSPILHEYYTVSDGKYDTGRFFQFLISENIADNLNKIKNNLQEVTKLLESSGNGNRKLEINSKFEISETSLFRYLTENTLSKLCFREVTQKLLSLYDENRPDIPAQIIKAANTCPHCREILTLFSEDSEMRCERCGYIETLYGTLFEDSQFYNQQITCTKHKKHNPVSHSAKWLNQLQAKENKNIPKEAIDAINKRAMKEYTRSGVKRSMAGMKCRQVRGWIKELRLTRLNNHAPLIRKIITGLNGDPVSPPQLSVEEEQMILLDFSRAIELFGEVVKSDEILRLFNKTEIHNKLYYPFFLLKILTHHFKHDGRLSGLIDCIHFQSSGTLTKDDLLWKRICQGMKGYDYEPTDRTVLVDIF
jgi:hypothetical protein